MIVRIIRSAWRGISKVFGARVAPPSQSFRTTYYQPPTQGNLRFFLTPLDAFKSNNIARYARRQANELFFQRTRQNFTLASFIGFLVYKGEVENEKRADIDILLESFKHDLRKEPNELKRESLPSKINDYEIIKRLGKPSAFGAVYHAKHQQKDVAVKMLFNHHSHPASSTHHVILKNFEREYSILESGKFGSGTIKSFGHPNIIKIKKKFVDETAIMYDARDSYPFFLPPSVDARGIGHHNTLYLVMPKYTCSLPEYIQTNQELDFKVRLHLLCQLLEGVAYLENHNIAHRDIKSDNILIKTNNDVDAYPRLAIADFGSCFKSNEDNMLLSYQSDYVDKGGNPALMSPEILSTQPGHGVYLNYEKSDAWAAGAVSYEIFGQENPLYVFMDNYNQIPPLRSNNVMVDAVVDNLLQVDLSSRLSGREAGNMLCLVFFGMVKSWMPSGDFEGMQRSLLQKILSSKRAQTACKTQRKKFGLFETFTSRVTMYELKETIGTFSTIMKNYLVKNYVS